MLIAAFHFGYCIRYEGHSLVGSSMIIQLEVHFGKVSLGLRLG